MKKTWKLISLLVILGLLVGGYAVYNSYLNKQNEESEPQKDTSVELLKIDSESVVSIEYMFEEESVSLTKTDDVWGLKSDADFPVKQSIVKTMTNGLSNIVATREIAQTTEKEADFGLDTPSFVISFSTKSGQSYDYSLGDYNSVAEGYYAKISGQERIYLVANTALDSFSYGVMDMIETETLPTVDAENITSVEVKGGQKFLFVTTDDEGATFYSKPYTYFTKNTKGETIAVDAVAGAEFMSAVAGLSFNGVEVFKPDAEKYANCGLSQDKRFELVVNYKEKVEQEDSDASVDVFADKSYSVYIGKNTDDKGNESFYAILKDSNILYKLKGGEELYKSLDADFESKLVCPISKDDALSVKVEIKPTSSVYSYSLVDIEKDTKLTEIYNKINSVVFSEKLENAKKGKHILAIEFEVDEKTLVLNVYKYNENNYIASFDTVGNMLVSIEQVDNIIKSLKDYNK